MPYNKHVERLKHASNYVIRLIGPIIDIASKLGSPSHFQTPHPYPKVYAMISRSSGDATDSHHVSKLIVFP